MAQTDVSWCRAATVIDRLQKRRRLELLLAVTLPFKRRDVSPNLFGLAIDQTQKRWAWFTKSRERNDKLGTELGTLVYLPCEIRQQVFKALYHAYFDWTNDWPLCYMAQTFSSTMRAHDIFDLASYCRIYQTIDYRPAECPPHELSIPIPLRLSSPTLGLEFDDCFLFNTIFKFESSARLQMFLDQLSDFHLTKVRRIIISIWVPCGCRCPDLLIGRWDGWKTTCSQLPASLQQVSFDLDYSRPRNHTESCRRGRHGRLPKQLKAAANLVEVLSKRIARSAPGAVLEMHEHAKRKLLPMESPLFDAAVNDVER